MNQIQPKKVDVELLRRCKIFPDWADAILVVPYYEVPEARGAIRYFEIIPLKRSRFGDYYYAKKSWRVRRLDIEDEGERGKAFDQLYAHIDYVSIVTRDGDVVLVRTRENDKYINVYPRKTTSFRKE